MPRQQTALRLSAWQSMSADEPPATSRNLPPAPYCLSNRHTHMESAFAPRAPPNAPNSFHGVDGLCAQPALATILLLLTSGAQNHAVCHYWNRQRQRFTAHSLASESSWPLHVLLPLFGTRLGMLRTPAAAALEAEPCLARPCCAQRDTRSRHTLSRTAPHCHRCHRRSERAPPLQPYRRSASDVSSSTR